MIIPNEARAELSALSFGLTPKQYANKIWSMRRQEKPQRTTAKWSWPESCRTEKGFVLRAAEKTKVTQLRKGA